MKKNLLSFLILFLSNSLFSSEFSKAPEKQIRACVTLSAWADALGYEIKENNTKYRNNKISDIKWYEFFQKQKTPLLSFKNICESKRKREKSPSLNSYGNSRISLFVGLSLLENHLSKDQHLIPSTIARYFLNDTFSGYSWNQRLGLYQSYSAAYHILKDKDKTSTNWWNAEQQSAKGSGSVTRVYPCGLFYSNPEEVIEMAIKQSHITQGHSIALAACAAMASGISLAIHGDLKTNQDILAIMINSAEQHDRDAAKKFRTAVDEAKEIKKVFKRSTLKISDLFNALFKKPEEIQIPYLAQIIAIHKEFLSKNPGWNAQDAISAVIYLFALSDIVDLESSANLQLLYD